VENLVLADRHATTTSVTCSLAPLSWPPGHAATTVTAAGSLSSPMPAGGIPTRMPPWPLHARSTATCPRAGRRCARDQERRKGRPSRGSGGVGRCERVDWTLAGVPGSKL
jgi:hypothetical protein